MSDTPRTDPWDGWPEDLKRMCRSLYFKDGEYGHGEVIEYLSNSIRNAESEEGDCVLLRLSWVHELFMNCFDPELHQDAWIRCADLALRLVGDAERSLTSAFPEAAKSFARDYLPSPRELDVRCLLQDLNAFGCVAAGFAGSVDDFRRRLDAAVKANELNVRLDADQLRAIESGKIEPDLRYGRRFIGPRLWTELLEYIAGAALYMDREADVAEAYRRYASHLMGGVEWGAPFLSHLVGAKIQLDRLEGGPDDVMDGEWPPF